MADDGGSVPGRRDRDRRDGDPGGRRAAGHPLGRDDHRLRRDRDHHDPDGQRQDRRHPGQACLPAIAGQVERLADGCGTDPALLRRWLGQVDGRGGCAHPDGAVRLVRSALRTFGADLERHAGGRCSGDPARVLPVPRGGVLSVPPGGGR